MYEKGELMGLVMLIKCPDCRFTDNGRLGMGEEGLGYEYQTLARQELKDEHPNHSTTSGWKFVQSDAWKAIKAGRE